MVFSTGIFPFMLSCLVLKGCNAQLTKMGLTVVSRESFRTLLELIHHHPIVGQADLKEICYPELGCFNRDTGAMKHLGLLPDSPDFINTQFFLYTRKNPHHPLTISRNNPETLRHINPSLRLVVLIHGWGYETHAVVYQDMKDAFLSKVNVNVIFVDWRAGSLLIDYIMSAINTELVGRQLAVLLNDIKQLGIPPRMMHIVGFSLGSHVAGFAGKWAIQKYGFKIGRISALDPAGFLFETENKNTHVSKGDANFVDVLHTGGGNFFDSGSLGMIKPVGDVDFYPNGGSIQTGCVGPVCSHIRAAYLYIATIQNQCAYLAYPCKSRSEFLEGSCKRTCRPTGCGRMGFYSITTPGRGSLYLRTPANAPYCSTP